MGVFDVGFVDGVLKRIVVVKLRRGEVIYENKVVEYDIKKFLFIYYIIFVNG